MLLQKNSSVGGLGLRIIARRIKGPASNAQASPATRPGAEGHGVVGDGEPDATARRDGLHGAPAGATPAGLDRLVADDGELGQRPLHTHAPGAGGGPQRAVDQFGDPVGVEVEGAHASILARAPGGSRRWLIACAAPRTATNHRAPKAQPPRTSVSQWAAR